MNEPDYTNAKWMYYAKVYRNGLSKNCEPGYTNERWTNLAATHTNAAYYCCTAGSHTKNCSGYGCNPGCCIAAEDSDRNANEWWIEPDRKVLPAYWTLPMKMSVKNAVPLNPPPSFLKKPAGLLLLRKPTGPPTDSTQTKTKHPDGPK